MSINTISSRMDMASFDKSKCLEKRKDMSCPFYSRNNPSNIRL